MTLQLIRPVPANSVITQTFDMHVAEARKHGWCTGPGNCPGGVYYYGGIDWGIPMRTRVILPMSGRTEVQNQGDLGYGLNVRITGKDGYYVILAHLSHTDLKTGDDAIAGNTAGESGTSGNSTGPHLHFELRHNGVPIDPLPYLTGAVVPPPVEPPVVTPPLAGKLVRIGYDFDNVGLRTEPSTLTGLIIRLDGVEGHRFEFIEEVDTNGRKWAVVKCFIASEFVEPVE